MEPVVFQPSMLLAIVPEIGLVVLAGLVLPPAIAAFGWRWALGIGALISIVAALVLAYDGVSALVRHGRARTEAAKGVA